jgi:hypothetical protein
MEDKTGNEKPNEVLENGLSVRLWKLGSAGGYSVIRVRNFDHLVTLTMNRGQPFDCAYTEAEFLAIVIDAEFIADDKVVRKSLSGQYYKPEPKKEEE